MLAVNKHDKFLYGKSGDQNMTYDTLQHTGSLNTALRNKWTFETFCKA